MSAPIPAPSAAVIDHADILVLDACVMMSGLQRRLLLALGAEGVFHPAWSERIGQEWQRNAARLWNIPPESLRAEWQAMQDAFPRAAASDIDHYKEGLRYSDPKDWHVIAAARAMQRQHPEHRVAILTLNLKDFNRSELRRLGLAATTPDRQLGLWWPGHSGRIRAILAELAEAEPPPGLARLTLEERIRRERLFTVRSLLARNDNPPAQ